MGFTPSNPEGDIVEQVARLERRLTDTYLEIQELKQGIGIPYADYPPTDIVGEEASSGVGSGGSQGQDAGFSRGNHDHELKQDTAEEILDGGEIPVLTVPDLTVTTIVVEDSVQHNTISELDDWDFILEGYTKELDEKGATLWTPFFSRSIAVS